ncbi:8-oxoguanine DNA glycosylase OGG fold protein [Streptomyces chartreusis]|uniref:8-oxoguanine DNA glycosylase OGG fold protein n=1 Tax=Streptomyces chartreusis TaxID=1969 RepID=UPI0036400348
MDPEVGGDLFQRDAGLAVARDPHDVLAELLRIRLGHCNFLPGRLSASQVRCHPTLQQSRPAFLTKFLYFAGQALPAVKGPRPLILDSVLAGVLCRHATKVGCAVGYEWSEAIAKWIWRDSGWSSHRYDVYLRWMYAANDRLAATSIDWPAAPDVLELALFSAVWDPE